MCFVRALERRNPGPGPERQRRNDRGDEENYKAAANTLRKNRKEPVEPKALTPVPRHETPRSNASFETKHRPLAEFLGSLSWIQSVTHEVQLCENKIARRFLLA